LSLTVATPRASRWLLIAVGCAGVATVTAIVAEGNLGLFEPGSSVNLWLGLAPGVAWLGAGVVAWGLRPANPAGLLMTAVGFSYLARSLLSLPREPLLFTLGLVVWSVPLAFAVHLFMVFPEGTTKSAVERRLIALAYVLAVVPWFVQTLFRDPARDYRCPACPENLLLVEANADAADAVIATGSVAGIGFGVAIAVVLVRRWRAATATARRALAPVLGAALVTLVLFVPVFAFSRLGEPVSPLGMAAWLASALVPLAFLVGLLRTRLQQGGVAELVVDLGAAPPAGRIRELLARTLGDPSVELAFWRMDTEDYVDAAGAPVAVPDSDGQRAVSVISHGGLRLAALIHDRSLLENPRLLGGVSAAARLALENARLQAELRAQLREVRASRVRIVEAGDEERRRIERNLHDGAQQHLLAIRLALRLARKDAGPPRAPAGGDRRRARGRTGGAAHARPRPAPADPHRARSRAGVGDAGAQSADPGRGRRPTVRPSAAGRRDGRVLRGLRSGRERRQALARLAHPDRPH
jgi:signal transduction histidine kinase